MILKFYRDHPCLLFSLSFFFGIWSGLHCSLPFLIAFLCFITPFFRALKTVWPLFTGWIFVFFLSFLYCKSQILLPTETAPLHGKALLSLHLKKSSFSSYSSFRATLHRFEDDTGRLIAKNVPCFVKIPSSPELEAGSLIRAEGIFKAGEKNFMEFKAHPDFTVVEKFMFRKWMAKREELKALKS